MKADDRVYIAPLGVMGTVVRVREDDRVAVLADCAGQVVVWEKKDLEVRA